MSGPHALMLKRDSDGKLQEAACTDAGEIKIASELTLEPTNLATSAKQDDVIAALAGGLPLALGAGGGLKIDGSGTALPISAASLPLPTGAATSAKQDDIIGALSTTGVKQGPSGDSGDPWYVTEKNPYLDSAAQAEAVDLGGDYTITVGGGTARALWVGSNGNVKVDMASGTVTFTNVPNGSLLKIQVTKVYSTVNGTSASDIVALY